MVVDPEPMAGVLGMRQKYTLDGMWDGMSSLQEEDQVGKVNGVTVGLKISNQQQCCGHQTDTNDGIEDH